MPFNAVACIIETKSVMSDWPVGLSTGCFYRTSIFDCLEKIRGAGFSVIEVCSFPAHLDYHDVDAVQRAGKMIDDLELEPYSFHAPFAGLSDVRAAIDWQAYSPACHAGVFACGPRDQFK